MPTWSKGGREISKASFDLQRLIEIKSSFDQSMRNTQKPTWSKGIEIASQIS